MTVIGTDLAYTINEPEELYRQAHALASSLRLRVLKLLSEEGSLYINEIAERLSEPPSTVALNIRVLEEAGLIVSEVQPGTRGGIRRCSPVVHSISFKLATNVVKQTLTQMIEMPIGGYSACDIRPVCGLLNDDGVIGQMHRPNVFFLPERFSAQLLWFSQGYVEYRFPCVAMEDCALNQIELSFEACSEAPHYCDDWPSDISVWIEGVKLGTWTCPGDFGGRQGKLTPEWWPPVNTQFGQLKTWTVTRAGTLLDWKMASDVTLSDLLIEGKDSFSVRIGIEPDAERIGGLNLFGERFGDYPQALRMKYMFTER